MYADSIGPHDGCYPIRSGNHTIALGGNAGGLVRWEITIAELLSKAGYATSIVGKWHIGAEDGRWPTDHGFDEWYGPLRTYDECMWLEDPHYDPERDGYSYMREGRKGEGVRPILSQQLDMEMKKTCDLEYQKRSLDFMERSKKAGKPFYLYFNHSLMHFPMSPRDEFAGKSSNGDWGDCLLMLDHDFGVLLDKLDSSELPTIPSSSCAATTGLRITWSDAEPAASLTVRISVRLKAASVRPSLSVGPVASRPEPKATR